MFPLLGQIVHYYCDVKYRNTRIQIRKENFETDDGLTVGSY